MRPPQPDQTDNFVLELPNEKVTRNKNKENYERTLGHRTYNILQQAISFYRKLETWGWKAEEKPRGESKYLFSFLSFPHQGEKKVYLENQDGGETRDDVIHILKAWRY